jgi:hypothetical protein
MTITLHTSEDAAREHVRELVQKMVAQRLERIAQGETPPQVWARCEGCRDWFAAGPSGYVRFHMRRWGPCDGGWKPPLEAHTADKRPRTGDDK